MAEPVGTALGALGVLGLLSVCIDSFNFIEDGRSVGKGFTLLRGEMANLRFRLLVWCRACKFFDEGGYDARLNHPELRPQILAQLNAICLLFMDAKKVIGRYDVPPSSTQLPASGSSAVFVEEGLHDFLKRIKDTKSRAGFRGAFLWALKDKRAFQELIERLEKCISALELVTANLDLFAEHHVRRAVEIEIETLSDAEVLSDMVAASKSSRSGSLISGAASQRILSLRSQPGTHGRPTVSSDSQTFHTAHTLHHVHPMETMAEESAFSLLDVSKPALREALQQFLNGARNTCSSLFGDWISRAGNGAIEASAYVQETGVVLNAPTSYCSSDGSGSEAPNFAAQSNTENAETLSNDLLQISQAVQETFWDLRSELRNGVEHGDAAGVSTMLQAAYSKLPPIVLAASEDLLGKLPSLAVFRESLLIESQDEAIREFAFQTRRTSESAQDGLASNGPLLILSGYLQRLPPFRDHPRSHVLSYLIRTSALRFAMTAFFWALVGHLEAQANAQASSRNAQKRRNEETHGPLDDHEWGQRLLEIKRKDGEVHTRVGRASLPARRLQREARAMAGYPFISLRLMRGHGDAPVEAIVTFETPPQSSYATGIFQLHVAYPAVYPQKPMEMHFLTKVYHPNIDQKGRICLNLLDKDWRMSFTTGIIVMAICALLSDPHTDDPLVPAIATTYIHDGEEYTRCATLYTKKYAKLEAAGERLAQLEERHEEGKEE